MSSDESSFFQISPGALDDLDDVWRYTAEMWSIDQADNYIDELTYIFKMIATMPTMARERTEFNPPVRIHTHRNHLIIYTLTDGQVVILRILGGRQNWQALLRAME